MPAQVIQIVKKYDEALNKADSKKYKLSIQLALDGFSFSIYNDEINKFLSIESITFENTSQIENCCTLLKKTYSEHSWLNLKYKSVNIIFESQKSTLIPSPLFDESKKEMYSDFNFAYDENHEIIHNKLTNLDAYNIYTIPVQIKTTLNDLFPGHKLQSHSGPLIESLLILHKNLQFQKRIFVNVRNSYLDIIIIEERKLLYYNSFNFRSKEDFIYYVIFVLEQLKLNPEEIDLILSGYIDKNSKLFDIVFKYVRNIRFQELTESFKYSYIFNDIPSHYYFNLLNVGLCEL
ncbi:MAG: hypothetical protein B6D61_02685 [Bacteroidetes bacterium 4484_249]|nr:MAG: hypothetical protein B6D61_02685 [Bacteroidetes bacterium 4484_249]